MFVTVCIFVAVLGSSAANKFNRRSVNVALETVFEFGDHKNDLKFLDNVQSIINKIKTVISNRKISRQNSNVTNIQKFNDFLLAAIDILDKYNNEDLEMFFKIFSSEAQKYRYKDCKFSELMNDYGIQTFFNRKLNYISQKPGSIIKKHLVMLKEAIKKEQYDKNVRVVVDKINSFYGNNNKKMLNNFLINIDNYNDKFARNNFELRDIIKKGLQSIVFNHYSSLVRSKRMELKNLLENCMKYSNEKIETVDKIENKNKKVEIITKNDINYRNKNEKVDELHKTVTQNDRSVKQNGSTHMSLKQMTSHALSTTKNVDKHIKEAKLKTTHKPSVSLQSNVTKKYKALGKDNTKDVIKNTTTTIKSTYLTLYPESITKKIEKETKYRFSIVRETTHAHKETIKTTIKPINKDNKKRFDIIIRNDVPEIRAQYLKGKHHHKKVKKYNHHSIEERDNKGDNYEKIKTESIYKRTHRFGLYESDKISDDDRSFGSEEKRILHKRIKKTGFRSGIKRNKSSKLKTKHKHRYQILFRRNANDTNSTTNENIFIPLSIYKPNLFKNTTQFLNLNNTLKSENNEIKSLKHDLKNIREHDVDFKIPKKGTQDNETEKYDGNNAFSDINNIVDISELKVKPDVEKNLVKAAEIPDYIDDKINEIDHKEHSYKNFNKTNEYKTDSNTEIFVEKHESKKKSINNDAGSELVKTVPEFRTQLEDYSKKDKDAQNPSEHSEEVKMKAGATNNSSLNINFELSMSDLNDTLTNEGRRNIFIEVKQ